MKTKFGNGSMIAIMVIGLFVLSSLAYADATIVDNLNMDGTANTSFGIYDDEGNMMVGQNEQVNGTVNRTRVISIDTSDDELRSYIDSKDGEWSAQGLNDNSIENIIGQAVHYLNGEDYYMGSAPQIGQELDSYFASDKDIQVLLNYIEDLQMKSANLNFRVTSIERTLEEIASDDFCNAKLETAQKYNITLKGLKCGLNSTYYYTVDPATNNGNSLLAIETYNPNVDTKPIKMSMAVPSSVTAGKAFNIVIVLNNTGSKFGFYKLAVKVPATWKSDGELFSGTIADNEVKNIIVEVTPGEGNGNITTFVKIVLSGKTYNLMANAQMNADAPVTVEEPTIETKSEPSLVVITANMIYGIGNELGSLGSTVRTSTMEFANGSADALNNFSEMVNDSGAPLINPILYPTTTSTIPEGMKGVDISGMQNILNNISFPMENFTIGEGLGN